MENTKNRWIYLIAGTVVLLFAGLIYGWSLFRVYISETFDWSASQLSLTFTISMIGFCLGGLFAGFLLKRLSTKVVLWISAAMIFAGFFGSSMLQSVDPDTGITMLYICYGALCGTGVGITYLAVISTINMHFRDIAATASGIMMMGFGLGALVLGTVVKMLVESIGLFTTFKALAFAMPIVIVLGSFFIVPVKKSLDKGKGVADEEDIVMFKTPQFWGFFVWQVLLGSAAMLVINAAVPIAMMYGVPTIVALTVSLLNGVGRVIFGRVYDKFSHKLTMFLDITVMLAGGALLYFGSMGSNSVLVGIGLLSVGLSFGGVPPTVSSFVMDQFGAKNYSVNFSVMNFAIIPSAIIGPMVSSYLFESSGGKYDSNFIFIGVLAVACYACLLLVAKTAKNLKKAK